MYIYNLTTNVTEQAHDKWLLWMRQTHIPAMLATGKFTKAKLVKVSVQDKMGGLTYSAQYTCATAEDLKNFYRDYSPKLNKEMMRLFVNQIVLFGTELEIIEEFAL